MRERERLLWNVLIILLLIIAGYMGYNVYRMGRQVREYREAMIHEALGSEDPQLRETVENLESDLRDRMAYTFEIDNDPLELSQVIQSRGFLSHLGLNESLESLNRMRLSCTVMGLEPAVVIKYQGRSRVLRVGDTISGYRVTAIAPGRAVLRSANETLELVTEKAPESIQKEQRLKEGPITLSASEASPSGGNY